MNNNHARTVSYLTVSLTALYTWRMPRHAAPASPHVEQGRTIQFQTNRILAALSPDDLHRLAPHLTDTPLTFRRSLSAPGQKIAHVCFPDSGVCSVMSLMESGKAAEVATVGNEGMTG